MKRAIFRQLTIGAFVLATVPLVLTAQDMSYVSRSDVLAGLNGIHVIVDADLGVEAEGYGLTKRALLTAIELRLRQAGVPVLTLEESLASPRDVVLAFYLNLLKVDDRLYVFGTWIEVVEAIWLTDGSERWTSGVTWRRPHHVGTVGVNRLHDLIETTARQFTDEFLNDYLKANPKK